MTKNSPISATGPEYHEVPKVSVIIVNWNGAKFLERCLAALVAQTVKPHEIILLDNASTDDSLKIARCFTDVRLMPLKENTGFARGNNLAIEAAAAETEWIALINPDAFAEPDWLEELLAAIIRNPGVDVFSSKLLNAAHPELLDGAGDAYHMSGRVRRIGKGLRTHSGLENEVEVFSPSAAAALYKRAALSKVGGFDEAYFCYVEDVDLGFRLRLAGYRCLYVSKSVALHVGSGTTGGQHSDFAAYHGHRNLVWTFVKDMPGILFWALLPLHIMLNAGSILWLAMRGQGRVVLRAKRDAIRGLPLMWKKRRDVQKKRVASIGEIWRTLNKDIIG